LALSYCWGGLQKLTTTTSNIADNCKKINFKDLPCTIQDAVTVTRALSFKFLWVDALCILQDCKKDKQREISHMGQVYKDATLMIAASSASSVDEGFLYNLPATSSFQLPLRRVRGQVDSRNEYWVYKVTPVLGQPATFISAYLPEALDNRGWTLQESLLSLRVLAFGSKEMTWRCQTKNITQSNGIKRRKPKPLPRAIFRQKRESTQRQITTWHTIVEDFSGRGLSFRSDRMLALAGIATEFAKRWKDNYRAGLWEKSLPQGLAWTVVRHRTLLKHPLLDQKISSLPGPSWSWISLLAKVEFFRITFSRIEIIDCSVDLLVANAPFASVTGGRIILKGYHENTGLVLSSLWACDHTVNLHLDDGSSSTIGGRLWHSSTVTFEKDSDILWREDPDSGRTTVNLGRDSRMLWLGDSYPESFGLFLLKTNDDMYKRIGTWVGYIMLGGEYITFSDLLTQIGRAPEMGVISVI
jgi:hypothetical protein